MRHRRYHFRPVHLTGLSATPRVSSAEIMEKIDALDPEARALVYEYGFNIVAALIDEGGGLEAIAADLETWRQRKQAAHLRAVGRGDYQIPKSAFLGYSGKTEFGPPKPKVRFSI